jgi:hypothetical protein
LSCEPRTVDNVGSAPIERERMDGPRHAGEYQVVYADPPWRFTTYSDKGKGRSAGHQSKGLRASPDIDTRYSVSGSGWSQTWH